jgi:YYY domain-containing protein
MIDERLPAPASERLRGSWKVWLGVVLIVAVFLAAGRLGDSKLMLPADRLTDQLSQGTWHELFSVDGLGASAPLPLWILALVGAGLIGFPYAWLVARSLPDRGYAIGRVVGLLLVTWVVWWLASLRVLPFTRTAIWTAIAIVTAGAVAITVAQRHELSAWVREHWRLLVVGEGVFWTLFALFLFIRWSNSDLWHASRGGEKPMDMAYLNAVAKSSSFPPYDPWFAGGQMNYYYYGFVQVAALAKLTTIPPAVAYNLAVPTLAGLLGAGSFSAALGLVAGVRRRAAVAIAALAAVFVVLLGNLGELRVLRTALNEDFPIPIEWWFWNPTRVIHPGEGEPGPITEMPAFTFIYGDLHAHAMALPLAALALALVVAAVRAGRGGWSWLRVALLGLVLGALWVTNTWDLPTYGLVAVCGLALVTLAAERSRRSLFLFGAGAATLIAVAYVAFLPFHLHYEAVFEGFQRWEGRRTPFSDYLVVNGFFLFAIVSGLLVELAFARDLGSVARACRLAVRSWDRIRRFRELHAALVRGGLLYRSGVRVVPAVGGLSLVLAAFGHGPAALALAIAAVAALSWPVAGTGGSGLQQSVRRLLVVFTLVGLALTIGVEYFVAAHVDIGRVNTVFKLYLQVWLLWALAAAVSVGVVFAHLRRMRRGVRNTWRLAFALLLLAAALYPVLGARAKIGDRFETSVGRTLDGTAFMRKTIFNDKDVAMPLAYDLAAIRWMQEHVHGSPVVAEVNTAPTLYGWQLRYAMFTGNPAIIGWDWHQRQQRPTQAEEVVKRVTDVQELYRTTDPAVAHRILTRYGASYAVVGPLERAYFPEGTAKWAQGTGRFWDVVYSNPGVRIFRVAPSVAG